MNNELKLSAGEPAPGFTLLDLNGQPFTLNQFLGQIVVINFWSAECPWSKRSDEEVAPLIKEWGDRVSWIFIAPNANETLEEIKAVSKSRNLPLVLHDPERQVTDLLGAETTPHIYVIDTDGMLRYQGAYDDVTFRQRTPTRNYLKEAVTALLDGKAPATEAAPPCGCTIVYYPEG